MQTLRLLERLFMAVAIAIMANSALLAFAGTQIYGQQGEHFAGMALTVLGSIGVSVGIWLLLALIREQKRYKRASAPLSDDEKERLK